MTVGRNAGAITWGGAALAEVAIVAVFIVGWLPFAPVWVLTLVTAAACIVTTLTMAIAVLAVKSQNKAMVGQLTAIGIPAMTLALLSGVSLLSALMN
nr:hypothetical protein [uncultured Halomonas sp.]